MNQLVNLCIGNCQADCDVEYHVENDGIGSYEFWGAKCFDAGQDFIEIDDIKPIFTDEHSLSDKDWITKELEFNFEKYADEASLYIDLPDRFDDCDCDVDE
jgi:hypothetical protein